LALVLVSFIYEQSGGFGALFLVLAALAGVVTVTGMLLPGAGARRQARTVPAE
jgi:hypothetical protein